MVAPGVCLAITNYGVICLLLVLSIERLGGRSVPLVRRLVFICSVASSCPVLCCPRSLVAFARFIGSVGRCVPSRGILYTGCVSCLGSRLLGLQRSGIDSHRLQERRRAQHVGEQDYDDAVKPFHTGDQLSPRILHTPAIVAAGSSKSNRGAILNGYWIDGVEGGTRIVEMELIASDAGPGTPITSGASIVELESASNPMPSSNFLISIPWNGLGFAGSATPDMLEALGAATAPLSPAAL